MRQFNMDAIASYLKRPTRHFDSEGTDYTMAGATDENNVYSQIHEYIVRYIHETNWNVSVPIRIQLSLMGVPNVYKW